jgi:hypothetical protein
MKLLPVVMIAAMASMAAAASPLQFRFSGEIRVDAGLPDAFNVAVQQSYVRLLDFPGGLKLELTAPADAAGDRAQTDVRLLQTTGDTYRVLHEAHIMAPARMPRTFSYLVCRGEAQYFSPAPKAMPPCVP